MVVLQMLFVRDFFSETICVRKHRGILCIPWQKELGSFPSASLSKEFEGGEREREECYQYLVKVRTPLDLSCKKRFFWACTGMVSVSKVQQGREKKSSLFSRKM